MIDLPVPDGAEGELYRETSGQTTFVEPGPLYQGVKAMDPGSEPDAPAAGRPRRRRPIRKKASAAEGARPAKPAPDAGKLAAVKTLLEFRKTLTSAQVQEELKLDAVSTRAILKYLVEEGLVTTEGKARGARYLLRKRQQGG